MLIIHSETENDSQDQASVPGAETALSKGKTGECLRAVSSKNQLTVYVKRFISIWKKKIKGLFNTFKIYT